jgi:hypothetical protein
MNSIYNFNLLKFYLIIIKISFYFLLRNFNCDNSIHTQFFNLLKNLFIFIKRGKMIFRFKLINFKSIYYFFLNFDFKGNFNLKYWGFSHQKIKDFFHSFENFEINSSD